jgi:hypothetical protein
MNQTKPFHRRWLLLTVVLFAVCVPALWILVKLFSNRFEQSMFEQIQVGMTVAQAESILGKPTTKVGSWAEAGSHLVNPPDRGSFYIWEDWDHQITLMVSDISGTVRDKNLKVFGEEEPFLSRLRRTSGRLLE